MLRLTELSVVNFAALGTRSLSFAGRSTVVCGANEAGKTTLSDALLCALFGKPSGNTKEGQVHLTRYGASGQSRAVCDVDGRRVESDSDRPCGAEHLDEALFRELLCSQRGMLDFRLGDPELNAALSSAALGAGRVSMERAKAELAKVFDTRKNYAWMKLLEKAREAENAAEARLAAALGLRGDSAAFQESQAQESALAREVAELEAAAARVREARQAAEAEELRDLKARNRTLAEKEQLRSGAGLPDMQTLAERERNIASLRSRETALERERSLQAQAARDAEAEADAAERKLAGLAETARLDALDAALRRSEAAALAAGAAGNSGRAPAWVALLAAGAAALVFGAPAWKLGGMAAGLAAALAAGALAWFFAARQGGDAGPAAADALREASAALEAALRAAGWGATAPEEAGRRCAQEREERARAETARDNARARALASREKARGAEAELEKARRERTAAEDGLTEALRAWNVNDRAGAERWLAAWEGVGAERKTWEAAARTRLPAAEDLHAALDRRLLELEGARVPADLSGVGPADLEKRDTTLSRDLEGKRARLDVLRRESSALAQRLALKEASLGGTAEALLAAARKAQADFRRIVGWRDAAQEAHRVLEELSAGTAARMEELFAAASPMFQELTGGRYAGVRRSAGPGEPQLKAVHAAAGERPLEWLSSGAGDALWLSVRLTLARRAMPDGGLILLDEPFHSLDPVRAGKALQILLRSEGLKGFQVIVLTKDDRLADLAAQAGALRLSL